MKLKSNILGLMTIIMTVVMMFSCMAFAEQLNTAHFSGSYIYQNGKMMGIDPASSDVTIDLAKPFYVATYHNDYKNGVSYRVYYNGNYSSLLPTSDNNANAAAIQITNTAGSYSYKTPNISASTTSGINTISIKFFCQNTLDYETYGPFTVVNSATVSDTSKALSSISLIPGNIEGEVNTTIAQYQVTAKYSDNSTEDITSKADISSSDSSIVTVKNGVLISGNTSGTAKITVNYTYNGVTKTATSIITVNQPATLNWVFANTNLVANSIYKDANVFCNDSNYTSKCTYSSSDESIAKAYLNSGILYIDAYKAGTVTLKATYGSISKDIQITITQPAKTLSKITLAPASATVNPGTTVGEIVVTAVYSDGTSERISNSSATITSNNTSVVNISGNYLYASNAGIATITATYQNQTAASTITVNTAVGQKTLKSIIVSPGEVSTITNMNLGKFVVTAYYSDNTSVDISNDSSLSIISSDNSITEVVSGVLYTRSNGGNATIKATYNNLSSTCNIKVTSTGTTGTNTGTQIYKDVPTDFWAYKSINEMTKRKILEGYDDGYFRPNDPITREQFAKILVLSFDKTIVNPANPTFADVPRNYWAYPYIETVKKYLTGYKIDYKLYFKGTNVAVREDMAVAIVQAKGLKNKAPDYSVLDQYSDRNAISPALKRYVTIALNQRIIEGYGNSTIGPQNTLTRAEACELIYKANVLSNQTTSPSGSSNGEKVLVN